MENNLSVSTHGNLVHNIFAVLIYGSLMGGYLLRVDSRKPHGESLSIYQKSVGNTFAVLALQEHRGAHDTTRQQQPERANPVMGDSLVTVTVKLQLAMRASYRVALGYGRLYYRNSHSRHTEQEALDDRLRSPPLKICQEYIHSGEDYAGMGTRISSCLPVFTRRSFIPGLGCRCGDVGHQGFN
ncbi:hypothetical protein EDD22DRAFT_373782 [Suillus occidentalis]|nr:hypothetical protein EDD22DRAFT_373782 [Suillus occidentalis]